MANEASSVLTSAGYLLIKAGVHMSRRLDEVLAAEGLTGRELLVLAHLSGGDELSQQELSRRLGLDPTIVVGLVDGLEERSLVTRTRDGADRRRYILSLTPGGRRLARRATSAAATAEADQLGALDPAQQATLRTILHAVMRPHLPWLP